MTPYYKKNFYNSVTFAKNNNISLIRNEEGKYLFEWEIDKIKFVLGNKKTEKPKGKCIYFNCGLDNISKVYTYQYVKYLIKENSERILREFCGYDIFNQIGNKDNLYKLNKENSKLTKGYKNSEIYLLKYLKDNIDPTGEHEIGFNELISYFQDKLDLKIKYPFYEISQSKINFIDKQLNELKNQAIENKKYFGLIYESFQELYVNHLFSKEGKNALNYLINRGLTIEEIKNRGFGLGFSGHWLFDKYQEKLDNILKSKISLKEFEKFENWTRKFEAYNPYIYLGLLNQTNEGRYDSMINRITIPITNSNNELIAFGGRDYLCLKEDLPKYMITKSSINWQKSDNVFGYSMAKYNMKLLDKLMVVEGFMDALALNKIGIPSVALMGVNCSNTQAELIKSLNPKSIFVSLDFDEAGNANNDKVIKQLSDAKLNNLYKFEKSKEINTKDFDEFINQQNREISLNDKTKKIIECLSDNCFFKSDVTTSLDKEL